MWYLIFMIAFFITLTFAVKELDYENLSLSERIFASMIWPVCLFAILFDIHRETFKK